MLTLTSDKENVRIMAIKQGKSKRMGDLYWHPVKNVDLRNSVEDFDIYFEDENFRDRFQLNTSETREIKECIENNEVCEQYQQKYFKVKRYLTDALFTEMNLSGSNEEFLVEFPKGGTTYGWCAFICGGSGAGKSFYVVRRILQNLNGPKRDRRKFIYCSAELTLDTTLKPVRDNEKYREYFTGVDISEEAIRAYDGSPEDYFKRNVELIVESAEPGTILVADDAMDSDPIVAELMRKLIVRIQRVGRHRRIGVMFLLHKLKSGSWSSQAYSSCKYIVVFPRSQKNKIRDMLEVDFGITKRHARELIEDFSQTGREMIIHCHSPNYIANTKLIRLI